MGTFTLVSGLARALYSSLRPGPGRRGSLGQELLMAIFLAGSGFGSGMRISSTPAW